MSMFLSPLSTPPQVRSYNSHQKPSLSFPTDSHLLAGDWFQIRPRHSLIRQEKRHKNRVRPATNESKDSSEQFMSPLSRKHSQILIEF